MSIEIEQTNILDLTGTETLTSVQLAFIKSIICGSSIAAAARVAGISRRTATTWMQPDHEIRQSYERLKAQYHASIFERLKRIQMLSLEALEASLSPEAPVPVRFTAAKFIYEQSFSGLGHHTLPHDPDDCPQPRTMTEEERRMEEIREHGRQSLISISYKGLTEEEVTQVEETIERHRRAREARNTGLESVEVDLRLLTIEERAEFEALDDELCVTRLVRSGHMTEKEAERERKLNAKYASKRR